MKVFNTTGVCVPEKHYMVNIENRLKKIKKLVDDESLWFRFRLALADFFAPAR